jgi:hypothetical protein
VKSRIMLKTIKIVAMGVILTGLLGLSPALAIDEKGIDATWVVDTGGQMFENTRVNAVQPPVYSLYGPKLAPDGGIIYAVQTSPEHVAVRSIDPESGATRWQNDLLLPSGIQGYSDSKLATDTRMAVSQDGNTYIFSSGSSPYATTYTQLYAINWKTGDIVWKQRDGDVCSYALRSQEGVNRLCYLGGRFGPNPKTQLTAFDAAGSELGTTSLDGSVEASSFENIDVRRLSDNGVDYHGLHSFTRDEKNYYAALSIYSEYGELQSSVSLADLPTEGRLEYCVFRSGSVLFKKANEYVLYDEVGNLLWKRSMDSGFRMTTSPDQLYLMNATKLVRIDLVTGNDAQTMEINSGVAALYMGMKTTDSLNYMPEDCLFLVTFPKNSDQALQRLVQVLDPVTLKLVLRMPYTVNGESIRQLTSKITNEQGISLDTSRARDMWTAPSIVDLQRGYMYYSDIIGGGVYGNSSAGIIQTRANFMDLMNHPAEPALLRLYEKGIIAGDADGRMNPDAAINREQFAVMLARSRNYPTVTDKQSFSDIPTGRWSQPYIEGLVKMDKFLKERELGHFDPEKPLVYKDAAVWTAQMAALVKPPSF